MNLPSTLCTARAVVERAVASHAPPAIPRPAGVPVLFGVLALLVSLGTLAGGCEGLFLLLGGFIICRVFEVADARKPPYKTWPPNKESITSCGVHVAARSSSALV